MAQHTITLKLTGSEITTATLNPQEVSNTDTVTWAFVNDDDQPVEGLRVEFQAFLPNNHSTPLVAVHPFSQFGATLGPFTVYSAARAGLYLYAVIDSAGNVVKWNPSILLFRVGNFVASFGGIVKPIGPP